MTRYTVTLTATVEEDTPGDAAARALLMMLDRIGEDDEQVRSIEAYGREPARLLVEPVEEAP